MTTSVCVACFMVMTACSSTPSAPTLGEKMIEQGKGVSVLGKKWKEGKELIEEGEELIEDGEDQVEEGEEQVKEGQDQITEGKRLIRQGSQMVRESESLFLQQKGNLP